MRWTILLLIPFFLFACEGEEEPPPAPPTIDKAQVTCKDEAGQDYQLVDKISVEILDVDRDLVVDTLSGSVNGVPITFGDGALVDDVFEWSPPAAWDPPMTCRGDFRISVKAADAKNLETKKRFVVSK